MKRIVPLLFCICVVFGSGCIRTPEDTLPPDTIPAQDSDTSASTEVIPETTTSETEPPETEYINPPTHTIPTTYNNIREYAASPDAPVFLRELAGLPEGFEEILVETGGLYCINYSGSEGAVAFYPFETEAALEEYMTVHLNNSGTYESLLANDLISDIRKTDLSAGGEILYECLYNTRIKTDLKLRYREFTADGIRFVLSSSYSPDGSLLGHQLFAFCGDASFACIAGAPLTDTELSSLRSIPLK